MNFNDIINKISGIVWGDTLIILILGVGLLLTVKTKGVQILHLKKAFRLSLAKDDKSEGEVSAIKALCTSLSATIGTGNIVGVATAVSGGGPGALFWMIVSAFLGMATKYAEGFLAIKYRKISQSGHTLGGPFYYIEYGLSGKFKKIKSFKWLAKLFAFFGAVAGLLGIGTITQINSITASAQAAFPSRVIITLGQKDITASVVICGIICTVLVSLVLIGGVKRIANFSGVVVPFMAVVYISLCFLALIFNMHRLPSAVTLIFNSAFNNKAIGGAIAGITLKTIIKNGVGRGIFSNEAGLGSAPIAIAAAKTSSAQQGGLISMIGTFVDTIVICTMTGLVIVLSGAWNPLVTGQNLEGFDITAYAFKSCLPFLGNISVSLLSYCLMLFAFTSIIGWNYYGERCAEYLVGTKNKKALKVYRFLYILAVAIGPFLTVSAVWGIADIFNGLMALPNLAALLLLSSSVAKESKKCCK